MTFFITLGPGTHALLACAQTSLLSASFAVQVYVGCSSGVFLQSDRTKARIFLLVDLQTRLL